MPIGSVPAAFSTTNYKYVVTIGGELVNPKIPLSGDGVQSLNWTYSGEGTMGQCSFTIEDPDRSFRVAFGGKVQIADWSTGAEVVLWGGVLVEAVIRERGSNLGRLIDLTANAYDAWLDWKYIDRFVSKKNASGKVNYYNSDRDLILELQRGKGGQQPIVFKKETIAETTTSLPNLEFVGVTWREALEQIADAATSNATDDANRFFYVDEVQQLHWYKDQEKLVAPYSVTDDIYTRRVLGTSGLVSLWRLTEKTGTAAADAKAYAAGTYTGGVTLGVSSGVINEPYLTAATLNGSTGYITASGANLHPGDTFTIEMWFKRGTLGTVQTLWSGGTNDVEIGFDASNKLVINKEGGANHYTSTAAITDTSWHYLAVRRTPGTTTVHLDSGPNTSPGDSTFAGTVVAQTFVAAAGAVNIGRRVSLADRYFSGSIACVAVYSTDIGKVEAMRHATIGDGINPVGLEVTVSAYDGVERVYIAGRNAAGSGWVERRGLGSTTFGRSVYGKGQSAAMRDAFLDKPEVESKDKKNNVGWAYLKKHDDPRATASFQTTGYDGWRPGQLIYIYNRNLDCITRDNNPDNATYGQIVDDGRGAPFEITSVSADVSMGNGIVTYSITCGPRYFRGSKILMKQRGV